MQRGLYRLTRYFDRSDDLIERDAQLFGSIEMR
jgi:hypothetical protein